MNIGFFGDSYVDDGKDNETPWHEILADNLNASWESLAVGGCSLDYCYYQFLKNYEKFDKIIFIITSSERGSLFTTDKFKQPKHLAFYQRASFKNLEKINNGTDWHPKKSDTWDKTLKKTLKHEVEKIQHYDANIMYHHAYLDSIKLRRPDTYFVHAFEWPTIKTGCMFNISLLDVNKFNLNIEEDYRTSHMSQKQNQEFATYMTKHLKDKNFNIHDTMTTQSVYKYYTTAETIEDTNWYV